MRTNRRLQATLQAALLLSAAALAARAEETYQVRTSHPRLIVEDVAAMARRCTGPLAEDYRLVKERADAAVKRGGIEFVTNPWSIPEDLMNCGLAYLIERELGHESRQYADVIVKQWGDGGIIANREGSHFGYHALAYDWIYDALTPEQRVRYGDALGSWLRFFTDQPEILLKWGHWEYNQTWGPIHLNVMNCRDALTQKLFIALTITGAGTRYEADAKTFLDSWNRRVPAECLPAFDRMGGVWSESYGHGAYGPVTVIPYAFQAWRTATGIDYFKQLKPWGYPVEEPRWVAYTMMPHNERTAWIDDGDGSKPAAFARAAPMLHDGLSQWFSDRGHDWLRERWQRVACYDPAIPATPPDHAAAGLSFPRRRTRLYAQRLERSERDLGVLRLRSPIRRPCARRRGPLPDLQARRAGLATGRPGPQRHRLLRRWLAHLQHRHDLRSRGEVPPGQGQRERRRPAAACL